MSNSSRSLPDALPGWLDIGRIVGAQGLRGEVRVYPDSDFPERFLQPGQRWLLRPDAREPEPIQLQAGRYIPNKGLYVLLLAGVVDRNQAEDLRGCRLLVPETDRPPLEADEFHVMDLIGLEVFDQAQQTLVGTVVDVIAAGNDLLEVERVAQPATANGIDASALPQPAAARVLIPFVKAIVPVVDLQQRRIEITPPAGLI